MIVVNLIVLVLAPSMHGRFGPSAQAA